MRSFNIILIALALLSSACEKSNPNIHSLTGTWVLKKIYADPGDGSGRYRAVTDTPQETVTFNADRTVISDSKYFGLGMLDSFKVVDTARVNFIFKPVSSYPTTTYRYRFQGDTLILNPPCIEGCGLKLVKQSARQ